MDASIPTIHVQETSPPEEDVFHAIVQKLAKQQRRWRLLTHLTQQTMESYSLLYNMFNNMVLWNIGQPKTVNREWSGVTTSWLQTGALLWQNKGTSVSALSTVVYRLELVSTMSMYCSTDRSSSLLTFTRNASQY